MATFAQLKSDRQAAGVRYATALAEFKAAAIQLAALDSALSNVNINPAGVTTFNSLSLRGEIADPRDLVHPEFTSDFTIERWSDAIVRQAEAHALRFNR